MAKVTGIGGVFFRSRDPAALQPWYVEHLGIDVDDEGFVVFAWGGERRGGTVWAPFPADTTRFGQQSGWMINYRVDDLDGMLAALRSAGVRVDDTAGFEDANGRFTWAWDPDGNRIELWEPAPGH